ncbi:MAG TPA: nucleotidyl transferase AbiEii/AbiGii toxin family protein [Treponemataceae bacterium]|nr:nucleotidyl transferase AbiEii/AbiGii toxin family protein [Treponemataceae bacterium]
MDPLNYKALYLLQDEVLQTVFEEPLGYYLTGGTALSRFYLNHRYSDDLDFFCHDLVVFPDAFRLVYRKLKTKWSNATIEVDARDFKRVFIQQEKTLLKLDFIADRVIRIGLPVIRDGIYIDTVKNILSNKLSAILGRDEERDIADLICITMAYQFSWKTILDNLAVKESFEREDLLFRIKTFPIENLKTVPFILKKTIAEYSDALLTISRDIRMQDENSLAGNSALSLEI